MAQNARPKGTKRGVGDGNYRHRADGRWEVRAALRDLDNGLNISASRQTVAQFLAHWLEDVARPTVRASTYRHYEQMLRIHIVPELGRIPLK